MIKNKIKSKIYYLDNIELNFNIRTTITIFLATLVIHKVSIEVQVQSRSKSKQASAVGNASPASISSLHQHSSLHIEARPDQSS